MERDAELQEGLRRSNARFVATMNRILEKYNHPFEDDFLVSMDTLTYDTPQGPKRWGDMSRKDVKKWKKKIFKRNRQRQRSTEISKQQSSDFEDEHSTVHQESSENSGEDTSDTGEARDVVSVRKKFEDIHLQNMDVDDGKIQKYERVQVDLIVQDDERGIPKWMTIPVLGSSKSHRSTSPVQELTGEARDVVSVRKKSKDFHPQNMDVDDGKIQKYERVQVDLIVQDDERGIPKWMTIPVLGSSKSHRSTSPVQELTGEARDVASVRKKSKDFHPQNMDVDDGKIQKYERVQVDLIVQDDERGIPKWMTIPVLGSSKSHRSASPVQELTGEAHNRVSVRKKSEDFHLQNMDVDDGKIQKYERVQVDLIVQDDERGIPKWMTIPVWGSSNSHRSTSVEELTGNQAAGCRKKLELSNECSSSKYLQLQHSGVPISSNAITVTRHRPCPELNKTFCDSIHGEYQSADEECSWNDTTLADLYPAMVEMLSRLMTKQSRAKVLKYIFRQLRSKRWHSRRPKLSVTADKIRGFRPCKPKKAFHSIWSCGSEDKQNPMFGNESSEFCDDNCLISNSSALVPYAYTDTNEIKMDYSDSSLEQHLASGGGQKVCKYTAFPDVMARMGDTFLVENELQPTASPKNSEYTESEKLAYKHSSEYSFITSTVTSDSRVPCLVKETKSNTQKTDFSCVGTSEFCSSACSSHGNSNNCMPITNYSPARSSNTVLINPEKKISKRRASFQHEHSFSPRFMKQSPSKMPHKYKDAFQELYYNVYSEELQKPLTLTRPLLNSQKLKEKGRLVKSSLRDFALSPKRCDMEFDRIYEEVCREAVPKFPGFQRASNLRKYEDIQMPQTVNALVNSPVRAYSAISRVKREGNFQNSLPCSPEKRLKLIPEHSFSSRKCQEISHIEKINLQVAGMDFLSTYNCSHPHFFGNHSRHCQDSGFHDSSDKTFLGIPDTSLQESGTAGACSCWPGAMENCSSPRNVRKGHRRVYRKLSYTDGKDQL